MGDRIKVSDLFSPSVQAQLKAAGHTLSEYEKQYLQAFKDAVKAADPTWKESLFRQVCWIRSPEKAWKLH